MTDTDLTVLKEKLSDLESRMEKKEGEVSTLRDRFSNLEGRKDASIQSNRMFVITAVIFVCGTILMQFLFFYPKISEISDINKDISEIDKNAATIRDDIGGLQGEIDTVRGELDEIEQSVKTYVSNLETEATVLTDDIRRRLVEFSGVLTSRVENEGGGILNLISNRENEIVSLCNTEVRRVTVEVDSKIESLRELSVETEKRLADLRSNGIVQLEETQRMLASLSSRLREEVNGESDQALAAARQARDKAEELRSVISETASQARQELVTAVLGTFENKDSIVRRRLEEIKDEIDNQVREFDWKIEMIMAGLSNESQMLIIVRQGAAVESFDDLANVDTKMCGNGAYLFDVSARLG